MSLVASTLVYYSVGYSRLDTTVFSGIYIVSSLV